MSWCESGLSSALMAGRRRLVWWRFSLEAEDASQSAVRADKKSTSFSAWRQTIAVTNNGSPIMRSKQDLYIAAEALYYCRRKLLGHGGALQKELMRMRARASEQSSAVTNNGGPTVRSKQALYITAELESSLGMAERCKES